MCSAPVLDLYPAPLTFKADAESSVAVAFARLSQLLRLMGRSVGRMCIRVCAHVGGYVCDR